MESEQFTQFLRTVLVNKLNMAGTIIIDIYESQSVPSEKKRDIRPIENVHNVFSQSAFAHTDPTTEMQQEHHNEILPASQPPEYIDSKTGHIYIQGDAPNDTSLHPHLARLQFFFQDQSHHLARLLTSQSKLWRKIKKQSLFSFDVLLAHGRVIFGRTIRFLRRQGRKSVSALRSRVTVVRKAQKAVAAQKEGQHTASTLALTSPTPREQSLRKRSIEPIAPPKPQDRENDTENVRVF